MKKIFLIPLFWFYSTFSSAVELPNLLDKVIFQVSAKQWVNTTTALVTVNVSAVLNNSDLVKARTEILANFKKISSGDWHVIQFDRSQDNSGLERLTVEAQARIPESNLTSIYQEAKKVSLPGATYTIVSIDFKPSLEEIQQAKTLLRQHLYQLAQEELGRLNKLYTTQNYTIHRFQIEDTETMTLGNGQARKFTALMSAPQAPNLTLSNELIMSALVEAASNRQEYARKTLT